MTTAIVEQMLVELGFDTSKFAPEADKAIKNISNWKKHLLIWKSLRKKLTKRILN